MMKQDNNKRRAWGIALLAIYVAGCIAVSARQFCEGFATLRDMTRAQAEMAASLTDAPSGKDTAAPSPTVPPTPSPTPAAAVCTHEYGAWETVVHATTTSNGLDERVCALCGAVESRVTNPKPTIDTSPGNESVQEMLRLINEARAEAGLAEVYYCTDIQAAADLRAEELNEYYDMQHNRPDGREAVTVFDDLGITYTMAGENYTLGPPSAELAMAEFMSSEGHRELILYPNARGVALAVAPNDEFGLAWVQIFVE